MAVGTRATRLGSTPGASRVTTPTSTAGRCAICCSQPRAGKRTRPAHLLEREQIVSGWGLWPVQLYGARLGCLDRGGAFLQRVSRGRRRGCVAAVVALRVCGRRPTGGPRRRRAAPSRRQHVPSLHPEQLPALQQQTAESAFGCPGLGIGLLPGWPMSARWCSVSMTWARQPSAIFPTSRSKPMAG